MSASAALHHGRLLGEEPADRYADRTVLFAELGATLANVGRDAARTTWRTCPACGDDRPSSRPVLRGTVYDFHRCAGCTMVYTPRVIHDEIVRARYTASPVGRAYRRLVRADAAKLDPESHALALDRVLDFVPSRGAAACVADAPGAMPAALAPRFDRTVTRADLDGIDGPFDVVAYQDVLGRMTDVARSLRAAHRLLEDGGVLYIGTPNSDSVGIGILGPRHPAVTTHLQVNLFNAAALEALAARHGFQVRSLVTNDALDLPPTGGLFDRIARAAADRWHLASSRRRGAALELVATKQGVSSSDR